MDGALSLSKKGICHSENEKSGGGLPIGVCEDMCLANTPYRRKITETRVFPLFFKSRGEPPALSAGCFSVRPPLAILRKLGYDKKK